MSRGGVLEDWLALPYPTKFLRPDDDVAVEVQESGGDRTVVEVTKTRRQEGAADLIHRQRITFSPDNFGRLLPIIVEVLDAEGNLWTKRDVTWEEFVADDEERVSLPTEMHRSDWVQDGSGRMRLNRESGWSIDPSSVKIGSQVGSEPWSVHEQLEAYAADGGNARRDLPMQESSSGTPVRALFAVLLACAVAFWIYQRRATA